MKSLQNDAKTALRQSHHSAFSPLTIAGTRIDIVHNMSDAPIIRVEFPLGTSLEDFIDEICRQAWKVAGTQLKAGVALGIRPETLARRVRRLAKLGQEEKA